MTDPFEKMWTADVEDKQDTGGEKPIPAGQHLSLIHI